MVKTLLKLCMSLKNTPILPKYVAITKLYHSQTNSIAEANTAIQPKVDISKQLYETLKTDNNPSSLVANIEANKLYIEGSHVIVALKSMYKFYNEKGVSPLDVQKKPEFIKLCRILNKYLITLDVHSIVRALGILIHFNVLSSTTIMQSLLQLLRCSINDLLLDEIYFLSFLLNRMEPTPLSNALIDALPKVFLAQLKLQLDTTDIKELKNALKYISTNIYDETDETITQYILNALSKYNNQEKPINANDAIDMLYSLCNNQNLPNTNLNILDRIENIIINDINEVDIEKVKKTLLKILDKIIDGDDRFYNNIFIDKIIDQLVIHTCEYNIGIIILRKLNRLKYIHLGLLKFLLSISYQHPLSLSAHPHNIPTLVTGMANANYSPPFWDRLQMFFLYNHTIESDDVALAYFVLQLLSLNCFDSKLVARLFASDNNPEFCSRKYLQTLQQVYRNVKTLYPEYSGPWPSKKLLDYFETLNTFDEKKDYPLLKALEKITGGFSYIKTNVKTSLGHNIDYLIILQNGYPIPIESVASTNGSDSNTYVEDLSIPPNSERLAILLLPPEVYGINIPILDASIFLNIKSLHAMSYRVVHISENMWKNIPNYEQLAYLQTEIGIKKHNQS